MRASCARCSTCCTHTRARSGVRPSATAAAGRLRSWWRHGTAASKGPGSSSFRVCCGWSWPHGQAMSLTGRAWLVPVSNKWGSVSVWCFSMPGVARIVLRLSEMYSTLPVDRASRLMRGRASAPAHSGFARLPQHRSLPIVTASCNNNNNELVEASAGLTGMDRRTLLRGALLGMMPALSSAPAQAAVVDEDRATSIYEAARQSVVAIVRLTKEASGAEVPSGACMPELSCARSAGKPELADTAYITTT